MSSASLRSRAIERLLRPEKPWSDSTDDLRREKTRPSRVPPKKGRAATMTHDYQRHRTIECLRFLHRIDRAVLKPRAGQIR